MQGESRRTRAVSLGAPIAFCLAVLATAAMQHKLSANGAPLSTQTTDFIVSSSRDAGPGTLREALLAADRLSTRAHVVITARRISIESALPALVNPHGVDLEASAGAGNLDAAHQESGAALQIDSPTSTVRGVHISHARVAGIIINVAGVQLDSVTVTDSKVGVLLNATARSCALRTSTFERDETGVMAEAGIRRAAVLSSIFRANARSGVWFVGRAETPRDDQPALQVTDSVFEKNTAGVVANQWLRVQKDRFLGNRNSAISILGGEARLEDNEVRNTLDTAVSVSSAAHVAIIHNALAANTGTAISVRDSEVQIEGNTLEHNGLGIVSVISHGSPSALIADNLITATSADAITLIGGTPLLQRNRVIGNGGVGLRTLDLALTSGSLKVAPRLEANTFKGNRVDTPVTGIYKMADAP